MNTLIVRYYCITLCFLCTLGQHYEDKRCRCVCPSPAAVINGSLSTNRKLFIASVPPNQCNCDGVILPSIGEEVRGHEQNFCPRCECKYESRNTFAIMVVVVMVVLVIAMLMVYMGFLLLLKPLVQRRHVKAYQTVSTSSEEVTKLLFQGQGEDIED